MSRTIDLLQAAYQRAGRAGVDAVVDLLDPQVEWLAATPAGPARTRPGRKRCRTGTPKGLS
jgi:hypothetical protein